MKVNVAGIKRELKVITANVGGAKKPLQKITANVGGVKKIIYTAAATQEVQS